MGLANGESFANQNLGEGFKAWSLACPTLRCAAAIRSLPGKCVSWNAQKSL